MNPKPYIRTYCCSPKEDEQLGYYCGRCGNIFMFEGDYSIMRTHVRADKCCLPAPKGALKAAIGRKENA